VICIECEEEEQVLVAPSSILPICMTCIRRMQDRSQPAPAPVPPEWYAMMECKANPPPPQLGLFGEGGGL
jgi:hypothetical protein